LNFKHRREEKPKKKNRKRGLEVIFNIEERLLVEQRYTIDHHYGHIQRRLAGGVEKSAEEEGVAA